METTVGLDLGTHQTKICIEYADSLSGKIYEFFEFAKPDGEKKMLLPSTVQINEDDTLSYGFVDKTRCKKTSLAFDMQSPIPPQQPAPIPRPKLIKYPEDPTAKKASELSFKEQLQMVFRKERLKVEYSLACKIIDEQNRQKLAEWEESTARAEIIYKVAQEEYERKLEKYNDALRQHSQRSRQYYTFRYFKLASFYSNQQWVHKEDSKMVTVWYLAYIIFLLREKLGEDFFIQMGIPSSFTSSGIDLHKKSLGLKMLLAAYGIVNHYNTLEDYLKAKYTDIRDHTIIPDKYTEDECFDNGIDVLPEAYAGLIAATIQGKIPRGMNLLIDVGGGTTDIAFFTVPTKSNDEIPGSVLPDIHDIVSFPKGMNFIMAKRISHGDISLSDIITYLHKNPSLFRKEISDYQSELQRSVNNIVSHLRKVYEFTAVSKGYSIDFFVEAIENDRPSIYCGGGSIFKCIRKPHKPFTDCYLIDKDMLNIQQIKNKDISNELYTILATSYGLSIPLTKPLAMTKLDDMFKHLRNINSDNTRGYNQHEEYGLLDT